MGLSAPSKHDGTLFKAESAVFAGLPENPLHTQRNGSAYRMQAELNLLVFNAADQACHIPGPA
ncbi:hypothetical protein EMIT091MI3_280010 [Kosakonia quasisacchari]